MVIDDPDDTHLVEMAFGGGFSMEEKEFAHVPGSVEKHLGSVAIRFGDIAMEGVDDALAEECAEAAGKDQEGSRDRKRHRLPLNGRICFIADDDVDGSSNDCSDRKPEGEREEIAESRPTPKSDLGFSGIENEEAGGQGDGGGGDKGAVGEV